MGEFLLSIPDPILIAITLVLMIGSLFLILVPSVPVTTLEWSIAMLFGALTLFERFPLWAVIITTIMMVLGITSSIWMPLFGLRGKEVSCLALVAFFVGMILGTGIPIPIIGNFIGGMIAVFLVEYLRTSDYEHAFNAGETAFWVVLASMFVEFLMAVTVIITTVIAIVLTA
ncbi:MAG: DUF456 family protein [Chloroflexota bacterium]